MSVKDIGDLLDDWLYDGPDTVRLIRGDDKREAVQIRVRIGTYHGILQFNCDGRPDGTRPYGCSFALDHHEDQFAQAGEDGFTLNHAQCEELFEESAMTYERYVVLLQLNQWDRVVRDTERNMRLFRFVNRYAKKQEDRKRLERWWPYILRIYHTAKAHQKLDDDDVEGALQEVHEGMLVIGSLDKLEDEVHELERDRSLKELRRMQRKLQRRLPPQELQKLETEKQQAVVEQDYERAATLRDRIRRLRGDGFS